MEFSSRRWIEPRRDPILQGKLAEALGIGGITAQVLVNRGFTDVEEARRFLEAADGYDPRDLPDALRAVERIQEAIEAGELIGIYGDYDADGLTGTATLAGVLTRLGARVIPRVPHRLYDGYGLCAQVVQELAQRGASLLITVDNGVSSYEEVQMARELGMDVIITDHHELPEELPPALAVVDPKRPDSRYPEVELAGVGVVYKLAQLLAGPQLADQYLDLVALGTVADVVPLKGENRTLVKRGLARLAQTDKPGLLALMEVIGLDPACVTAADLGYALGPRLNAVGRLDDAQLALQLLLAVEGDPVLQWAQTLEEHNRERREVERSILEQAQEMVNPGDLVHVLYDPSWHPGVIGIVASRLVETYHRPALLIGEGGKGSGRSIKGFNLYEALLACGPIFERCGGHPLAAGWTIDPAKIDRLREGLETYAREVMTSEILQPKLQIDAWMAPHEISRDLYDQMVQLAPFGVGNPAPVLAISAVEPTQVRTMGTTGEHLKMQIGPWEVVGWRMGPWAPYLSEMPVDVAFSLTINQWQGQERLQLRLRDIRLAEEIQAQIRRQQAYAQVAVASAQPVEISSSPGKLVDGRGVDKVSYLGRYEDEEVIILVNELGSAQEVLKLWPGAVLIHGFLSLEEQERLWNQPGRIKVVTAFPRVALPPGMPHMLWETPLSREQLRWSLGRELHLIYGQEDGARAAKTGELIALDRQILGRFYTVMRDRWGFERKFSQEDLVSLLQEHPLRISLACGVFQELGLLSQGEGQFWLVRPPGGKLDLHMSILYNECVSFLGELESLTDFLLHGSLAEIETLVVGRKENLDGSTNKNQGNR
jgi:single-stranded-DNA-specific exonuclease RecJ